MCKVSCTYRRSDHCSGRRQVRGPWWLSPAKSSVMYIGILYSTMAKAGKVREEGRIRRGMVKSVSHGHHTYTHARASKYGVRGPTPQCHM